MTLARRNTTGLAALLAVLMLFVGVQPADASVGTAVVTGSGSVSPGLTLSPTMQEYNFKGDAVITTDTAIGTAECNFSGGSLAPETILYGAGYVTGTCSASDVVLGPITPTCTLYFTRNVAAVDVIGYCTGNPSGQVTGSAQFIPTGTGGAGAYFAEAELAFTTP